MSMSEPFLSAELAYRRERLIADRGAVGPVRRRRRPLQAFAAPVRRIVHRAVVTH